MDVQMHNALSGYWAHVNTDVITARLEFLLNQRPRLIDQRQYRKLFLGGRVEETREMPEGNNQAMTWIDRIIIEAHKGMLVVKYDCDGIAE